MGGHRLRADVGAVPGAGRRLGDSFGRRRMFLIALSAFVITSALTGLAPSMGLLIAARLLQGAAAGMLIPQNPGLIQDCSTARNGAALRHPRCHRRPGDRGGPWPAGCILRPSPAPRTGGGCSSSTCRSAGDRAAGPAAICRPAAVHQSRRTHVDVVGALLLGAGVLGVPLPAVETGTGGLARRPGCTRWPSCYWPGSSVEARTARSGQQPLLDPRLLRISGYTRGAAIGWSYPSASPASGWCWRCSSSTARLLAAAFRLAVTPFADRRGGSAVIAGRLVAR